MSHSGNQTYNVLAGLGSEGSAPVHVVVGAVRVLSVDTEAGYSKTHTD